MLQSKLYNSQLFQIHINFLIQFGAFGFQFLDFRHYRLDVYLKEGWELYNFDCNILKSQFVTSKILLGMTKEMEKIEGKADEPVSELRPVAKSY